MSQAPVAPPWAPPPAPVEEREPSTLPTEPLAIAALVVATSTFFVLPLAGALAALIVAHRARAALRVARGAKAGRGLVVGATAVAWTNIGLATLAVVALVAAAIFTPTGRRVDFASLQPGDCFNRATVGSTVVTVRVVPCDSTHQHEVVGVAVHPADRTTPFPGADAIQRAATDLCAPPLQAYLAGVDLPADLRLGFVYPEQHRWEKGDRTIVCEVFDRTGRARHKSVRDE